MIKKITFTLLVIVVLISCTNNPTLPPVAVKLENISNNSSYDTYTVYFSARKIDLTQPEKDKQKYLIQSFKNFASGIGNKNAAVWAGSSYKKFDISVSKDLCDKYSVSYTGGPYIVFSKNNPAVAGGNKADSDVLIDFTHVNPERIKYILDNIEQKIRTNKHNSINNTEMYKQIVYSKYDNNKDFIEDVIGSILGSKNG